MNKEQITEYQKDNPLYYPTIPSLSTNCSINYDWDNCSSKEYGLGCRTCCNYNPLRMLYLKETGTNINGIIEEVLLEDCRIQLEKGCYKIEETN